MVTIATLRYISQNVGSLKRYDGIGRNLSLVDTPPPDLSPIDLQRCRRDFRQAQRCGRSASENFVDNFRGLPAHSFEARHATADGTDADEGVERPVQRCTGGRNQRGSRVARIEQLTRAVLEVTGGEHDGVRAQFAQSLLHRGGRQSREKFDCQFPRDGRDLAAQAHFPLAVSLRSAGHDDEPLRRRMPAQRLLDGAGKVVFDGDADHIGRQRTDRAPGAISKRPCKPGARPETAASDCATTKSSASSDTVTIALGGCVTYLSCKYVLIVLSYFSPLNSGRSRNSEKSCKGRSGELFSPARRPRSTATLPGTSRLLE